MGFGPEIPPYRATRRGELVLVVSGGDFGFWFYAVGESPHWDSNLTAPKPKIRGFVSGLRCNGLKHGRISVPVQFHPCRSGYMRCRMVWTHMEPESERISQKVFAGGNVVLVKNWTESGCRSWV